MKWFEKRGHGAALIAVSLIVILGTSGCAKRMVKSSIEKGIAERLPTLIGPADSYQVDVEGALAKMVKGKIKEIVIRGKGVKFNKDLKVDDLEIRIHDLVANPDTSEIKSVGDVTFEAGLSEPTINEYLKHVRPAGMKAKLLTGRMIVDATARLLRLSADVQVTGRLLARGQKVDFSVDKLVVAGINAPSITNDLVEERINPVLDLRNNSFKPELTAVTIVPGQVKVTGKARWSTNRS